MLIGWLLFAVAPAGAQEVPSSPTPVPTVTAVTKRTTNTIVAPPRREVPGLHKQLPGGGVLYAPTSFNPEANGQTNVVFFFLGAAWCAEQNFHDAAPNAVLVTYNVKEAVERLKDPATLATVLAETTATLTQNGYADKPLGRLVLSSFSGGYTSTRAILRHPQWRARVTDVVLADSLYAGRVGGADSKQLDPEQMEPFVFIAKEAAEGRKTLVFSQLYPPDPQYRDNTTTLAATYLIDAIGAVREPVKGEQSSVGAQILYRATKGNVTILGYAGMTNQDHFNHFYGISDLWRKLGL